ncbi:MAG: hypothetical protein ACLS37_12880 [Alistipes sp.]
MTRELLLLHGGLSHAIVQQHRGLRFAGASSRTSPATTSITTRPAATLRQNASSTSCRPRLSPDERRRSRQPRDGSEHPRKVRTLPRSAADFRCRIAELHPDRMLLRIDGRRRCGCWATSTPTTS